MAIEEYLGYGPTVEREAREYLNRNLPSQQTAQPAVVPQAPAQSGVRRIVDVIKDAETTKGTKLSPEELDRVIEGYRVQEFGPAAFKNARSKAEAEANLQAFDSRADQFRNKYFEGQAPSAATSAAGGSGVLAQVGENVAGLAGGVAQIIPNLMSLVDYGVRALPGVEGRTVIGETADALTDKIQKGLIDPNTTPETLAQRQNIAALPEDASIADTLKAYIDNPRALLQAAATGAGSLAGAAPAKIPSVARWLSTLGPRARTAVTAGMVGLPQSGGQTAGLERELEALPLEEVLKNESAAAAFQAAVSMGVDQERARLAAVDVLKGDVLPAAMAGYTLGNVGVAALPGLGGAEGAIARAIGGGTARNVLARTASGAASEAAQEGAAGALGQMGENVGFGRPIAENISRPIAEGATVGALVGAPVGAVAGARPRNPLARPAPAQAQAEAPGTPTPTPEEAPAQTAPEVDVPPGPGLNAENTTRFYASFMDDLMEDAAARKVASQVESANELVELAENISQQKAGETWAELDASQRQDLVEQAAQWLNRGPKLENVPDLLATKRSALSAPVTAAPQVEETPIPDEIAEAIAEIVATEPKQKNALKRKVKNAATRNSQSTPTTDETSASTTQTIETPSEVQENATETAPETESAASDVVSLPQNLSGAKPRFNYGPKAFTPTFESDVDKALFIVGQKNKSKRDADFRKFLSDAGLTEEQIEEGSTQVRAYLKEAARTAKAGPLAVPSIWSNNVPKQVAPTEEVGAEPEVEQEIALNEQPTEPTEETAVEEPAINPDEWETSVRALVQEDLTSDEVSDLVAAIRESQEGSSDNLNNQIRSLTKDEVITKDIARQIRVIAAERAPAPGERVTATNDADLLVSEEFPPVQMVRSELEDVAMTSETRSKVDAIKARLKKGEINVQQAIKEIQALDQQTAPELPTSRGVEQVRTAIQNAAQKGQLGREAVEFFNWVLDQNPNMARDLRLMVADLGAEGVYNNQAKLIKIDPNAKSPRVIVHELMHHTERMLPTDIRTKIREAYQARLLNKMKQLEKRPPSAERDRAIAFIDSVIYFNASPSVTNFDATMAAFKGLDVDEYYKYVNVTEYWAEQASEILQQRKDDGDSWQGRARTWMREFIERVKALFSLPNDHAVIEGLRSVMNGDGEFLAPRLLVNESLAKTSDASVPARRVSGVSPNTESLGEREAPTKTQAIIEGLANNTYAFEKSQQAVLRAGGSVNFDNSPVNAQSIYYGEVNRYQWLDAQEVREPVVQWVHENWKAFTNTDSIDDFMYDINKFMQNHHLLTERIPLLYVQNVPLRSGKNYDREKLLQELNEGQITASRARAIRKQVNALADKYAMYPLEQYAKTEAIDLSVLRKELADLATKNITQESLAELNDLLKPVRERADQRLQQAGYYTSVDQWKTFYGFDWYVPLKGTAYDSNEDTHVDSDIDEGQLSLSAISRQIKLMEGRRTFAELPFNRLFVDLLRAGERAANTNFTRRLYQYVSDNKAIIKPKITTYIGSPKQGYTTKKGGKTTFVDTLRRPKNGFIFNDGDVHYVVELPASSQLLRGLEQLRSTYIPGQKFDGLKGVASEALGRLGTVTSTMGKLYTTVDPVWQTSVAFIRATNGLPMVAAIREYGNPAQAGAFVARYGVNLVRNLSAAKSVWAQVAGKGDRIRDLARQSPDSFVGWLERYRDAGGSNEFTEGFDVNKVHDVFAASIKERQVDGLRGLHNMTTGKYLKLSANYAALLENIPRVAVFQSFVEGGMSDQEAAIKTRQILDYQQTGKYGRGINAWLAFFRVGATGLDSMRQAFTTPTGKVDINKLMNWGGSMAALGAVGYMMTAALLGDDENGEERIKKFKLNTLTQKIVLPWGDDTFGVSIELGLPQLLLGVGTIGAAFASGHVSMKEASEATYELFSRNGPVRPAGLKRDSGFPGFISSWIYAFVPTPFQPITAMERNVDAFGSPIHNEFAKKDKFASDQGKSSTPVQYKEFAKWIRENVGVDAYPESYRHLATSYGGQVVGAVLRTTIQEWSRGDIGLEQSAVRTFSRMGVRDEDFYLVDRLHESLDSLRDAERKYQSIKTEDGQPAADRALRADANLRARRMAYKRLDSALDKYYKDLNALRQNRLISVERKRLQKKKLDSALRQSLEQSDAILKRTK